MELELKEIEFTRDEVPVSKKLNIDGELFTLEVQYNEVGDFYTAILYDNSGAVLKSTKLVYLADAFASTDENMPQRKLIPLNIPDLSAEYPSETAVNAANFGDKVKLYLI